MKKLSLVLIYIGLSLYAKEQHPVTKVNHWFKEEKDKTSGGFHKLATLATVSIDGHPHTRMIELVNFNKKEGAIFFTNKNSQKVSHIEHSFYAALNIWLPKTRRQLSIDGTIKELSLKDTEKYWNRMSRFMKIIFIALEKQENIMSNEVLNKRKDLLEKTYQKEIPMPNTFIGYRFIPNTIIFYEMQPQHFPIKHIAHLENNSWNISQITP